MAYTKPKNPLDGYGKAFDLVEEGKKARQQGTGWGEPKRERSDADVQTGEVTDLEVGGYRSGALMAAAELIAKAMEVQPGEEGLPA